MRILFSIGLGLLFSMGARADTFNYVFTGSLTTLSGTMSGQLVSPSVYERTAMTGVGIRAGSHHSMRSLLCRRRESLTTRITYYS
jgi:hypothetical protein